MKNANAGPAGPLPRATVIAGSISFGPNYGSNMRYGKNVRAGYEKQLEWPN